MRLSNALAAVAITAAALPVHADKPTHWPLSNADHRDFFCAARPDSDNVPPAGYALAMERELLALEKKGLDIAQAVRELQSRARCSELVAAPAGSRPNGMAKSNR